jgi:hypothetical protein
MRRRPLSVVLALFLLVVAFTGTWTAALAQSPQPPPLSSPGCFSGDLDAQTVCLSRYTAEALYRADQRATASAAWEDFLEAARPASVFAVFALGFLLGRSVG